MNIRAYQNEQICLSLDGCVHRLTPGDCEIVIAILEAQMPQKGMVGRVKRAVAESFSVTVHQLECQRRPDSLCVPRFVCWLLLRESGMSLQAIADEFGARNHGTIRSGLSSLKDRIECSAPLKREIELLRKRLNGQ